MTPRLPIRRFMRRSARALPVLTVLLLFGSCNDVPVIDLQKSFALQVFDQRENKDPAKIDFIWVIDNSSSMCEEQAALARNFDRFVERLRGGLVDIDARVAVVNTNVLPRSESTFPKQSQFNREPATAFPPPCRRQVIKKCLADEDCLKSVADSPGLDPPPGESRWVCTWKGKQPATLVNNNGSVNSRCMLTCDADTSCQSVFGSDFTCKFYSEDITEPGCMVPPPVEECKEPTAPYLEVNADGGSLHLFPCIATVGADPSFNANLEQGLNAARYALDIYGPNADQAREFLRDDAWLVMIFVSDEDDCSLRRDCLLSDDGTNVKWRSAEEIQTKCIKREQYNECAHLNDANDETPGPLEPVSRFVNVFKSLKNDPSKVMVAAIVGDSQDLTASTQQADIDEYFESELARTQFASNTYICSSASGIADYGSRYIDLVKGFGGNGVLANICGPKGCVTDAGVRGYIADDGTCTELAAGQDPSTFGIVRALDLIGQTILRRVVRICLPRPVRCLQEDPEQPGRCLQSSGLAVNRITAAGDRFELVEAPPSDVSPGAGQYRIEEDTLCQETRQALFFGDLLERDDAMVVRYEGDSGLVE